MQRDTVDDAECAERGERELSSSADSWDGEGREELSAEAAASDCIETIAHPRARDDLAASRVSAVCARPATQLRTASSAMERMSLAAYANGVASCEATRRARPSYFLSAFLSSTRYSRTDGLALRSRTSWRREREASEGGGRDAGAKGAPTSTIAPRTVLRIFQTLQRTGTSSRRACCRRTSTRIPWRATAVFDRDELVTLISDQRIAHVNRMLHALNGLAALRHGEAAGLRWLTTALTSRHQASADRPFVRQGAHEDEDNARGAGALGARRATGGVARGSVARRPRTI